MQVKGADNTYMLFDGLRIASLSDSHPCLPHDTEPRFREKKRLVS